MDLKSLYSERFSADAGDQANLKKKNAIWAVLCREFFQKYIPEGAVIVDIGAGYCEFINNIRTSVKSLEPNKPAGRKIAVDLNEDIRRFAGPDVEVINGDVLDIRSLDSDSCDVIFISNFLEHLPDKNLILRLFSECRRLLCPGGRLLILQPNIRYVGGAYWDFFDHHTPLTEKSLAEALLLSGFKIEASIAQFLPYTTKSRLPQHPALISLYLKIPLVWRIMGKQCFVSATPK